MPKLYRLCLTVLLSLFAVLAAAQSGPQEQQQRQVTQPGNNAPVWRDVKSGDPAYTSIPGRETNVLIQAPARYPGQRSMATAGEAWRNFRNGPVTFWGGLLVVLVAVAIFAFYFIKGPVKLHEPLSGRRMVRFSALEMIVHWSTAISFCVLGISGLIMLFGKHVLLPVIGYTLFAWLTQLSKNLHNFIAPLFIVSVIAMILMWARDNLPKSYDWQWFRRAWAFFARSEHIPSGRFNAGEKVWFWGGVLVLSCIVAWSGLILLFPNFDQTRATMQDAWAVHATAALIYIVISFGHIYMGTIGVQNTYGNMRTGYTDETWAKEHHEIWYREVKSGEREPARGRAVPASIVLVLGAGLLVGAIAASYAKLPPPPPKSDAEKTAEAEKAAAQKAKEATDLAKAQDKAVANYKKNAITAGKK